MTNNKNNFLGFTLLEMSVVILIFGILLVGGINLHLSILELSEKNLSSDMVYVVDRAIKRYFLNNLRLPCPSNIMLTSSDDEYGEELRDINGDCYTTSRFQNGNYIVGGIPTKALELSSEYAEDAWNNKIMYVIDKNYATKKGFFSAGGTSINIEDTKGNVATNKAIYVIISAGQNGNGAFMDGIQNTVNNNLIDKENLFPETISFDNKFIKDINNKEFDDIVYYKDRNSLIFEFDIEDAPCSMQDLHNVDLDYPDSSVYCSDGFCFQGTEISSINSCEIGMISENPNVESGSNYKPIRKCQKYGQWSNIMYECTPGCGESNIETLTNINFPNSGDLLNSIDEKYLYRVKAGDSITLDCKNKSGYIILKCNDDRTWSIIESNCVDNANKI